MSNWKTDRTVRLVVPGGEALPGEGPAKGGQLDLDIKIPNLMSKFLTFGSECR